MLKSWIILLLRLTGKFKNMFLGGEKMLYVLFSYIGFLLLMFLASFILLCFIQFIIFKLFGFSIYNYLVKKLF